MNDQFILELDLRRSRRENRSLRFRSFARIGWQPRQVRDRRIASDSCELALPTPRVRRDVEMPANAPAPLGQVGDALALSWPRRKAGIETTLFFAITLVDPKRPREIVRTGVPAVRLSGQRAEDQLRFDVTDQQNRPAFQIDCRCRLRRSHCAGSLVGWPGCGSSQAPAAAPCSSKSGVVSKHFKDSPAQSRNQRLLKPWIALEPQVVVRARVGKRNKLWPMFAPRLDLRGERCADVRQVIGLRIRPTA